MNDTNSLFDLSGEAACDNVETVMCRDAPDVDTLPHTCLIKVAVVGTFDLDIHSSAFQDFRDVAPAIFCGRHGTTDWSGRIT